MKQSPSIAKLAVAFIAAQAELKAVPKDAINPFHKSKYASLDAIVAVVRPILATHGLAFVQGTVAPESDSDSKATAFTVETTLIHTSGEWWTTGVLIPLAKADPQGAGAAMTYGRRYSLAAALGVVADEDDDGNAASKPVRQQRNERSGGASSGATASVGHSAEGHRAGATAHAVPPFTRDTALSFGKNAGTKVRDLKQDYLQWATSAERAASAFGEHTAAWQDVFRLELDARAD